jgi:hypothetical protein
MVGRKRMKYHYQAYQKQLIKVCGEQDYWMKNLGLVGDKPIWFITDSVTDNELPNLLIVAGFHGEEKAGPWGLLEWLKGEHDIGANLSFIPIVNPAAFNLGKRYNTRNEKSNTGFVHGGQMSTEGKILWEHKDLMVSSSTDGMLSLHEDVDAKDYYVYTFEKTAEPGKFTCGLLDELGKHFDKPMNGSTVYTDAEHPGPYVVNGVVYKHCDGTFEDWLFHEGSARTAVTETPAYRTQFQRRVKANVAVIDRFIELCMEES